MVNILTFGALSIGSGPTTAVLLCIKRGRHIVFIHWSNITLAQHYAFLHISAALKQL